MHPYRTDFLGYPVDNINAHELLAFVEQTIAEDGRAYFAVQNANKMYLSEKDESVRRFIAEAPVILPENAINMGMHDSLERLAVVSCRCYRMGSFHSTI